MSWRIYWWCPYVKTVNSSKHGILLQFRRWLWITLSFDGLNSLNFKGDIPICSPIHLTVIERIGPSTRIFINHSRPKSKGKRYLNWKILRSFLWLSKTIWNFQPFRMPLKDFLNLVLACKEISPSYGSDRIKVFFSTVVTWGHFMTNLLITILKDLSINDKWCPFFKNTYFKKLKSS